MIINTKFNTGDVIASIYNNKIGLFTINYIDIRSKGDVHYIYYHMKEKHVGNPIIINEDYCFKDKQDLFERL
jgi:hypothetical protein